VLDDVVALLRAPWVDTQRAMRSKGKEVSEWASRTDKSVTSSNHLDRETRVWLITPAAAQSLR
jgi:hypothetical protein